MEQIDGATDQMASGAGQVTDSSQSLSQEASQTRTNAENANQANNLAVQARDAAGKGNAQMQDMVTAMAVINDASQKISRIIKVIDEIAFQTNLLALNAAVEAARAGKHGKGFAVVAEEGRSLAARSAKAARETADRIENSVGKAKNGVQLADTTAEALQKIVTSVGKITERIGEIAIDSKDQAERIYQINQELNQIDQITQSNTANAEETAATAEQLAGQTTYLEELLGNFKVDEELCDTYMVHNKSSRTKQQLLAAK